MSSEEARPIISILRKPDVMSMTGLPESSLHALIAKGKFPRPITLSVKRVGWQLHEIQAWLYARVEATQSETPEAIRERGRRPPRARDAAARPTRTQRPTKSTSADDRRTARN